MDSPNQPDMLSNLPNIVLIMIISSLSLKECVQTSILGRRWRNLCYETTNIAFKESDYVHPSLARDEESRIVARASFVHFMIKWVNGYLGRTIESFEISFSSPIGFVAEIEQLIAFAVSRRVKNLVLDFSDPAWRNYADAFDVDVIVHLPEFVYNLTVLDSLKIYACGFDPLRFTNPGVWRSLSIGWVRFENVEAFLSRMHRLVKLSISHCWDLDMMVIAGNMREFVFDNCNFPLMNCSFNLPNVDIFKYEGEAFSFYFERMKTIIKEVYLDFSAEEDSDEPSMHTLVTGEVICGYLNSLRSAMTLDVCPFLLQAIPESITPAYLLHPLHVKHLVLRTMMHPKEYGGIRMLLNYCPDLEILTFDIRPPNPLETSSTYAGINPRTYWLKKTTYRCSRKTLKVVVVKNFSGSSNELNVLKYLIRSGRGRGPRAVLDRVDLYLPIEMEGRRKMFARAGARTLQWTSKRVEVLVHDEA